MIGFSPKDAAQPLPNMPKAFVQISVHTHAKDIEVILNEVLCYQDFYFNPPFFGREGERMGIHVDLIIGNATSRGKTGRPHDCLPDSTRRTVHVRGGQSGLAEGIFQFSPPPF
jgi:hypothetical protein